MGDSTQETPQTAGLAAAASPMAESGGIGDRPECFRSTTQEVLFVLTATMAVAMSSFLTGGNIVITSLVGEQLRMTNAEITWISASSTCVWFICPLILSTYIDHTADTVLD